MAAAVPGGKLDAGRSLAICRLTGGPAAQPEPIRSSPAPG